MPAADGLPDRRAHLQLFDILQVQLAQHGIDTRLDFLRRQSCEAEAGREEQILIHRQLFYQQIVLRDEADELPRLRRADGMPVHGDISLVRRDFPVHDAEQRRFPDARTAHDGHQLPGLEVEGKVVQPVAAVFEPELHAAPAEVDIFVFDSFIEYAQEVAVIDRQEMRTLQDAAVLPRIEHIRRKGDIVHKDLPRTMIAEDNPVEPPDVPHAHLALQARPHDAVAARRLRRADGQYPCCLAPLDEGKRLGKLRFGDGKRLGNDVIQCHMLRCRLAIGVGELDKAHQEEKLLLSPELHLHLLANITYNLLFVNHEERIIVHFAQGIV